MYWLTTQGRAMMAATKVIHALSEGVIASRKKFKQQQQTSGNILTPLLLQFSLSINIDHSFTSPSSLI
jgi:hypothetical protein